MLPSNYALKSEYVAARGAINFIKRLVFSDEHEAVLITIKAIVHRFNDILETPTVQVLSQLSRGVSETVSSQDKDSSFSSCEVRKLTWDPKRCNKPPLLGHTLIGIEEKDEEVVESLLDVRKSSFVAICHRLGAGKTTLAKEFYSHTKVRCHFDYFAWVDMYGSPSEIQSGHLTFHGGEFYDNVCLEIIRRLITSMGDQVDDKVNYVMPAGHEEIKLKLDAILQGEKCLVVLNEKFYPCGGLEGLLGHFPHMLTGCKFLIISDSHLVTSKEIIVHGLGGFKSEDVWQLLQITIGYVKDCSDYDMQLETFGKNIAQHLNSWPWAIMVTGGLLAAKQCSTEWQKLYDDIAFYSTKFKNPLRGIFMLSYIDLPTRLKPFLFYPSRFPAGYEINVSRLVHIWIAEGFVLSRGPETAEEGETLEDLAESNLIELILRCLVLVGDRCQLRSKNLLLA